MCFCLWQSFSSLYVYLYVLDVNIFVGPGLVGADPQLNIISGRLRQVLAEPVSLVAASLRTGQTVIPVPEPVNVGVRVSIIYVTEVVLPNE